MLRVGIDVGGTFTDFAALSEDGEVRIAKTPTTHYDLSVCFMKGMHQLAREAGIEGTVAVSVLVSEEGKVLSASVLSSDVTPAMEKAALEAAKKCRFRPAKQRTVAVKAHVMIPFQFQLH